MSTVVKGCGLGLVFLATSGGCVQTSAGSSPSATSPEPASAESETPGAGKALLLGAVRLIDGADAPNTGEPIEVAAGCHVIQTSEDLLVVLTEGEVRGRITPAQIVVVMKPGFRYVVERKIMDPTAGFSSVKVFVREEEPSHRPIQLFLPAADARELQSCQPRTAAPESAN